MRAHRFLPLASFAVVACSSANFDVSNGTGGDSGVVVDSTSGGDSSNPVDTGSGNDGHADGVGDVVSVDSGGGDGVSSDGTTGCGTLGAADKNVYVDGSSSAASVGTAACPFHTIYEATSQTWLPALGHRTIHVAAGTYAETHALVVTDQVVLGGAGVGITQVSGGGACTGGSNCVFEIGAGAALHDVTVTGSSGGHAIVMDGPGVAAAAPLVHHVAASGAGGSNAGIFTRGSADVGPNVALTGNGRGLDSIGTGTVHVIAGATPSTTDNVFSGNAQMGIYMEGNAILLFDAGTSHHNGSDGIYFNGAAGTHTIRTGSFHDNSSDGILLVGDASLYVRDCVFENNGFGIHFVKTATNSINLGDGSSSGDNTFGTASVGLRNRVAGLCLQLAAAPSYTVSARDDLWSTCDPSISRLTACDASTGTAYFDIFLAPTSAATPDSSGCAPGP